ncbi:MAG: 50S ribosomal protein L21 [Candidatus Caenarcaniphilales bacterium]|jgi:large subunit ribosomal protein L21|nr:50S ribosomal protein L21 [Candidatus Caenarcaniphilales bacterium]
MYAIVDINSKQYKVEEGKYLDIDLNQAEEGTKLTLDQVLFISDANKVQIGQPTIKGASVTAVVMNDFKDDKVKVYKMHRKKGYRLTQGHRQNYTRIKVEKISA